MSKEGNKRPPQPSRQPTRRHDEAPDAFNQRPKKEHVEMVQPRRRPENDQDKKDE